MDRIETVLEMRVERTSEKPFLTVSDATFTFREVRDESRQYANTLAELGVGPSDAAIPLSTRSISWYQSPEAK